MTLLDREFLTAVAIFNMMRMTGPKAQQHRERGELLQKLALRVEPDKREEYGQHLAEWLTKGGLSHSTALPSPDRFRLSISAELLALPEYEMERVRTAAEVHLHIDSVGGDTRAALAILDAAGPRLTFVKIAHAGSASALLGCCAPGRRVIAKDGSLMLHPPSSCVLGDAGCLRRYAESLDRWTADWIARLVARTGQSVETVSAWLAGGDHHFTPEQALQYGLVDEVLE